MKRSKIAPETVGAQLKRAREKLGFSLEEVAKRTKIQPRILADIENNDGVERLNPVYVRSFLRMYARLVGLDEAAIMREFAGQHQEPAEELLPLASHSAPPPSMLPSWRWPTWRPTRQQLAVVGGSLAAVLVLWGVGSAIKRHAAQPKPLATTTRAVKAKRPSAPQAKKAAAPASASRTPTVNIPSSESLKLQVITKERTWLRVTADGKVIFQNVLEKGKTEQWTAQENLSLWLGNAGSVELALNGKSLGTPGRRGEVIKDLRVTRSGIQIKP